MKTYRVVQRVSHEEFKFVQAETSAEAQKIADDSYDDWETDYDSYYANIAYVTEVHPETLHEDDLEDGNEENL